VRWIPLLGPFHRTFPRYNAVSVLDVVRQRSTSTLATTAVVPSGWDDPRWQDVDEPALQVAVVPWARRRGQAIHAIGEPSPDPTAPTDAVRYLREAGMAGEVLRAIDDATADVEALLQRPLDLTSIASDLVPKLRDLQQHRLDAFGDGPGTDWLGERANKVLDRLQALSATDIDLLASVDLLPALLASDRVTWIAPTVPAPSEEARRRALLDAAFHRGGEEPLRWLEQLGDLDGPEARWLEAEVWLRSGHLAEALERLRSLTSGEFGEPSHLPGMVLARLGQLADLDGRHDEARRAYRGVLALDWAPTVAREVARQGLEARPTTRG